MIEFFSEIFLMRWLWTIFAGFYLVAYTFWIPGIFNRIFLKISVFAITLIIGGGLLAEGFFRAMELDSGSIMPELPFKHIWIALGGVLLLGYLWVYISPKGRIVAHWALDMVITLVAGVVMLAYSAGF
ncbi:MAG: hypothetical protein J5U17_09535 [Candidatus Methanoperedens sp.]|nr:hypothetical protein [Candidatus Methanoperedens sp.]